MLAFAAVRAAWSWAAWSVRLLMLSASVRACKGTPEKCQTLLVHKCCWAVTAACEQRDTGVGSTQSLCHVMSVL